VSATLAIRIRAKIDLGEIVDYLAERNETAAIEFVESVHREFQLLKEHQLSQLSDLLYRK
jgi:plasmid stabilization system protein ParE